MLRLYNGDHDAATARRRNDATHRRGNAVPHHRRIAARKRKRGTMQLFFLRHGIAEADPADGTDASRRLTSEGRAKLEASRAGLARLKVAPELLLTSPLVRAHQTAEIVGRHLGVAPLVAEALASGSDTSQLLALLAEHPRAARVMVVGHEPDFSTMIRDLTGARIELKKGALARVDLALPGGGGRLIWLVPPRGLR
jgi:phosphohistidine phosphatase